MLKLYNIIRVLHAVAYPSVLILKLAGRSVASYDKLYFFSAFSRLGHFSQVSGKAKERFILSIYLFSSLKDTKIQYNI